MAAAYWCVLIAALLPYLGTMASKAGGKMPVSANHNPREWLEGLGGWQKRAHWYQLNSYEAFPPFAAAVLIASFLHAPQAHIDLLAEIFIAFRVVYFILYISDLATLRTLAWTGGIVCTVWLFVLGA